ncbi:hypothetical protein BDZ97DRAFT_620017 [Flammula alnicola]|nr:hypothetical protein BDZ97DRAFT_620017 [Flammula alnicola]
MIPLRPVETRNSPNFNQTQPKVHTIITHCRHTVTHMSTLHQTMLLQKYLPQQISALRMLRFKVIYRMIQVKSILPSRILPSKHRSDRTFSLMRVDWYSITSSGTHCCRWDAQRRLCLFSGVNDSDFLEPDDPIGLQVKRQIRLTTKEGNNYICFAI